MKAVDTNVLIRYLTQDEPRQSAEADAIVSRAVAARDRLHLDTVVLCEMVWVLRGAYGFERQSIVDILEQILSAAQFSIDDRDLVRDGLVAYRSGRGDFADHILGLRNRKAGCSTTLTFDRSLKTSSLFTVV